LKKKTSKEKINKNGFHRESLAKGSLIKCDVVKTENLFIGIYEVLIISTVLYATGCTCNGLMNLDIRSGVKLLINIIQ
jgi:hypothetical protein